LPRTRPDAAGARRAPHIRSGNAPAATTTGANWARRYRARLRVSDSIIVTVAVGVSVIARFAAESPALIGTEAGARYALMSVCVVLAWLTALSVFMSRDLLVIGTGSIEYKRVVNASSTTFGLLAILFLVFQADTSRWFFLVALPFGLAALVVSRWLWRQWLLNRRSFGLSMSRVIIVGRLVDVEKVARLIQLDSGSAYRIVGAVIEPEDAGKSPRYLGDIVVSTDMNAVADLSKTLQVDGVIVAGQPRAGGEFIQDLAWKLENCTAELILATSLANVAGPRIHFRPVDGLPLIHVEIPHFDGGKHAVKRLTDITISFIALVLLAPLLLIVALLVKTDKSGGPVLFSQERIGRGGSTFRIHKFRSMEVGAQDRQEELAALNESDGVLFKIKNDPRVTRVGRVLRKYSLDELPQLWNVLMGDMSIVGPRPPLPSEVLSYDEHVHRRLYIKPGLTGMWQINGRSSLSWEESVQFDLYYVENWSVIGDLVIMWRTFRVLLKPEGAY
jgi:exopolysaccharide biosynthesis polyprenyl glycosylphosphotransferase